ncbi:MAG: hypothetical protein LJE59_06810 [Chromatiaceae bacterium]|nr:hypothetical protein [Chromatiaceae bacterium]
MLAPRALRQWIDALPLGNPPRAAQMLLQQLRLLVRDPQPGARLGALLDLYDVPGGQLLEIVNERLQTNQEGAVPLDQLEHSMLELLTELAYGRLRQANEALAGGKSPATATLYQAMRLLDGVQNIERLHYYTLDPGNWQLLLGIYLHAAAQDVADQPVDRALLRSGDEPDTVQGLFFRALVLQLCDPHQHRPEQMLSWHHWAGEHANLLELTILPQGPFAIPLDISGQLPPLAAARRGKPGPDMRYLAAERFLQQLQDDPTAPQDLQRTLHELIKGRKASEQRQGPRQPRNHRYGLMNGLRNIHARLESLIQGAEQHDQDLAQVPCLLVNQSRSGAALQVQGPLSPPLTVGEVLLIEAQTPAPGGAAVGFAACIRRLVNGADHQIEIGVEKLAGRVIPVEITGSAAQRGRGETRALLQQDVEAGRHTLFAPRSFYREGDSLVAESAHARHGLRMQELLEVVQHTAIIAVEPEDA